MPDSRPPTPETLEVKRRGRHRLIGAITLAVLAVVAIPMVLDSEPRKASKELALNIPAKDNQPALSAPDAKAAAKAAEATPAQPAAKSEATEAPAKTDAPVAALVPPTAAVPGKSAEKAAEKPAEKAPAKVEVAKTAEPSKAEKPTKADKSSKAEKADKSKSKSDEKAADKATDKAPKAGEGFVIQLGAFSDAEKLAALKAKMKSAKVTVFTEEVQTSTGKLTRLRAGPYKTREQADKALAAIKKAGVEGKVVPLS